MLTRLIVATVTATVLVCGFNTAIANSSDDAAKKPVRHEFRDPYKGGTRLLEGGAEPGKAYMAMIDAVYKKDYPQICKLMAEGDELAQCLKNQEALGGFVLLLGGPQSHKVLDGFMKGDEATLDVAYTWADMPESYGFVIMKLLKGKWVVSSFGGSGSTDIDVGASGTMDLGTPAK